MDNKQLMQKKCKCDLFCFYKFQNQDLSNLSVLLELFMALHCQLSSLHGSKSSGHK